MLFLVKHFELVQYARPIWNLNASGSLVDSHAHAINF